MIIEILGLFGVIVSIIAIVIYVKDKAVESSKAQFK